MTNIYNRNQFRAWLGKQPRNVAVAMGARAALRVLPVVQTAKRDGYTIGLVLPVFRAASVSWAAAKYPAYEMEFVTGAAYAYAAAVAAAATTAAAAAAADAAAIAAADAVAYAPAYAAVAYAPAYAGVAAAAAYSAAYAAVAAIRAAAGAAADDACAAYATTRSAAAAARATAVSPTVADTAVAAVARAAATRAAAAAAAYADDAIYAAAYSDARTYAEDAFADDAYAYADDSARASAYAGDAAAPFFWSAVSTDATRLEEGTTASVIAALPLWPQGQPDHIRSLWQELEAGLLAAKQDWQVWTNWYNDRVNSRVRQEERELAYVHIDEVLWNRGPAIVNAEIARRVEERLSHLGAARKNGRQRPAATPQDTSRLGPITL